MSPIKMVKITHPELGDATVPESAFRKVWSQRGYVLREDQPVQDFDNGQEAADEVTGDELQSGQQEAGAQESPEVKTPPPAGRRSGLGETGTGDSTQSQTPPSA